MKRFVVVGLGDFGASVAATLYNQGHEVIAIDINPVAVDAIAHFATTAVVLDAQSAAGLDRVGARNADAAVVATGSDLSAGVLAVMALRDVGVKEIFAKAVSRDHARVMERLGVDETVFPERDSGVNLALRIVRADVLLSYNRVNRGLAVQEMALPAVWEGKTLRELGLPAKYGVSVVAVHDALTDATLPAPDPDAILKQSDSLIIAGSDEKLARVARL